MVHGVAQSRTRLSDFTFMFHFMHWRRKWQPTPVFLPGESQGRGVWWAAISWVAQSQTRLKRLSSSRLSSICYLVYCVSLRSSSHSILDPQLLSKCPVSSVTQSFLTLATPWTAACLPVHHQFPEFTQTYVH